MRFGPVDLEEALGARLGHSVKAERRLPKGRVLDVGDIESLRAAGHRQVVVAQLSEGDVYEDAAAQTLADALATANVTAEAAATGRCNLHAARDGLFVADRALVDAVNAVHEGITLATLADAEAVDAGRMVATVKIIPFAVPRAALDAALEVVAAHAPRTLLDVRAFAPLQARMVSTTLPSLKDSVVDKTERQLRRRLERLGGTLLGHERVPHHTDALAAELDRTGNADLIVIFGASAVADPDDVVPAAIRAAGGEVRSVGMPVDPGNLLCLGRIDGREVIGAPGCARSPAENGFDWVLQRLAAGLPVEPEWVRSLGVGGLLMEIGSRPSPRERADIAPIVLAAGHSSRMGDANKLTRMLEGKAVIAHAVDAALGAGLGPVTVVTGYDEAAVRAALGGRDVRFVHNPDHAQGMSTSLRAGVDAAPPGLAPLIVLGDMPDITAPGLRSLAQAFHGHGGQRIVAAVDPETGRRGNPVLWPVAMREAFAALEGDEGARRLLKAREAELVTVAIDGAALDLDTPEAFAEREAR